MADARAGVLLAAAVLPVAAVLLLDPVPQDPAYHAFVDTRPWLGIANALNVLSNLAFLIAGMVGLAWLPRLDPVVDRPSWIAFCVSVTLVAFGSAWYHLEPDSSTLVWDRLPIAAACMALLALVLGDRVGARLGRRLLWPAIAAGLAAVLYWHVSEVRGHGDLRPYLLVQALPVLLIPLTLLLYRQGHLAAPWMWATALSFVLSKLAELADAEILLLTAGVVSGHTVKHLLSALAVLLALRAFVPPATAAHS